MGLEDVFKLLISLPFSWAHIEEPSRIISYRSAAEKAHIAGVAGLLKQLMAL
jgi:hypothetical protein